MPVKGLLGFLSMTVAILYFIGLGYSRIALNVHTWNQIIYGWLVGLWVAFTCEFTFREALENNVRALNKNEAFFSLRKNMGIATGLVILGLAAQIITYIVMANYNPSVI